MRPWILISLAVLIAVPVFATESPRLGETIDVSIVNVDAIVTDRQGNRVRGLTQEDFQIYENGKLQPISNFSEICVGQALSLSERQAGEPVVHQQPRTIVVFIEHFRTPTFLRDSFFTGMREFLHRTVRPGDSVKIVTFAKKLETRLDFTDNVAAIDRTLDKIESDSGPGVDEMTIENEFLGEGLTSRLNASEPHLHGPRPYFGSEQNLRFIRMRDKVESITSLMNSIAGSDSKKVFVMAVRRFGPTGTHDLIELEHFGTSYGWPTTNRSDGIIDYVAKTANANGITVYALHPEGLGREGFGAEAVVDNRLLQSQLPYLDNLATQTGGKVAWGQDIEKDLPKMADDLDAYYSIAYRATTHNVDRARKIEVKTKNPDYTIRSRREYVEKSDQTRMRERVLATLLDQAPASSMNITVEVGNRFASNGRYTIPITVYIPVAALMTDGGRGEFSVFVGWSGRNGEIGQVTRQSQKFQLMTNMPETFTYTFDVVGNQSTDRLSVGVFDELSKDYGLKRVELSKTPAVAGLR